MSVGQPADAFVEIIEFNHGSIPKVTVASQFPANRFFFELHKSGLLVCGQSGGMVQRAGMQPKTSRPVAPHFVDGPLKEPLSQPLPNEVRHQAELHQLNFGRLATI